MIKLKSTLTKLNIFSIVIRLEDVTNSELHSPDRRQVYRLPCFCVSIVKAVYRSSGVGGAAFETFKTQQVKCIKLHKVITASILIQEVTKVLDIHCELQRVIMLSCL